jgi:hypothetical protein
MKLEDLLKYVLSQEQRFISLSRIISVVTILPTSRACYEREFSEMNSVKNKPRSLLHNDSVK